MKGQIQADFVSTSSWVPHPKGMSQISRTRCTVNGNAPGQSKVSLGAEQEGGLWEC